MTGIVTIIYLRNVAVIFEWYMYELPTFGCYF